MQTQRDQPAKNQALPSAGELWLPMSTSPMRNLLRRRSSKEATRQQPAGGLATAARATQAAQKLKHPLKLELMRVDVRQIKNIDQIAQTFNARVFIQFRIDGGALDEALCEGLNDRGAEPALRSARWFLDKLEWHNAAELPTIITKMVNKMNDRDLSLVLEVEGSFLETFELENFPIDYQELTIKLRTACAREGGMPCIFCKTALKSCALNVDTGNFSLANVWRLEPIVDAFISSYQAMEGRTYPVLSMRCHIHRLPGFYVLNVVLPMGLFALMTLLRFRIQLPDLRLSFSMTLIFIAIAYKFVTIGALPAIAYLTLLDKFVMSQTTIIVLSAFEHGFGHQEYDLVVVWVTVGLWIAAHLYFAARAFAVKRLQRKQRRTRQSDRLSQRRLSRAASLYNLRTSVSGKAADAGKSDPATSVADAIADRIVHPEHLVSDAQHLVTDAAHAVEHAAHAVEDLVVHHHSPRAKAAARAPGRSPGRGRYEDSPTTLRLRACARHSSTGTVGPEDTAGSGDETSPARRRPPPPPPGPPPPANLQRQRSALPPAAPIYAAPRARCSPQRGSSSGRVHGCLRC